eukprot:CAMPEP_0170381628 /NCGR_PEP_ID=MMETSP0117_2-20130122/14512_1 /TAXON_ID=400756 /ORGANISM="Durinskia baltica, Strain CSIRO CS-38" /LENGTH=1472 /DNA_ID=CAMNT_0010637215 /DNA_START=229 /DNA_END=4647 /DNA_ORIENTATION=+
MAHGKVSANYSEALDIRAMVKDTIKTGKDIDRHIYGTNTLLHLAVENDLVDCVVKLLSSGADSNLENEEGFTARDLAIENGNQILLQVLSRRDEYTMHLQLFNRYTDVSSSASGMDQYLALSALDPESCPTDTKMVPLSIGAVYEDYIDWTDSQRCNHLQQLMDSLRNDEFELKRTIEALNSRRLRNNAKLQDLHISLRDREHALCLDVWSAIQSERHSRRALERASSEVVRVKTLLSKALDYVHYIGTVRVAPFKRVLFSSWHYGVVEITGSTLTVDDPGVCPATGFVEQSLSMSFAQKQSNSGQRSRDGRGSAIPSGADGDTDGSGTGSSYATEAMMAAHADGMSGMYASSGGDADLVASQGRCASTSIASTSMQSSSSRNKNKSFLSYSTGPVRRRLQKLQDVTANKRKISVQDIIAVEVYKEDRSLGPSYVQLELRIHYVKEGKLQHIHNLLVSPTLQRRLGDSVEGNRERLGSSSSSGSIAGSIRSTSTGSNNGAAAGLLLPAGATVLTANASRTAPGVSQKQRSVSTGAKESASTSQLDLLATHSSFLISNSAAANGGGSYSDSDTAVKAMGPGSKMNNHAEKIETVWFKLPLQSNTTTRAAAIGKKKRSIAADDGSGGPTLTFELFIAILRRVKENVHVYSVVHGVETPYQVSPAIGDSSSSSSKKTTAASSPSRASRTAVAGSPGPFYCSPNSSFRKKNASSGNLIETAISSAAAASTSSTTPVKSASAVAGSASSAAEKMKTPPVPQPLPLSSAPEMRTSSVCSSSSSCRTDSSSLSPKRNSNSATFNSRLSSSGGHSSSSYHGGSMNSSSGLTSIESLVGYTTSRSSHNSMSISASGSMSSSGSSYSTSSLAGPKGFSPRYEHKFMVDDALLEETTADIEGMEDDEDSLSRQQSQPFTDDDSSAAEEPWRFQKITRRHTEGTETLTNDPHSTASASAGGCVSASSFMKEPEPEHVDLIEPLFEGDDNTDECSNEHYVPTRHTISVTNSTDELNSTSKGLGMHGIAMPAADLLEVDIRTPSTPQRKSFSSALGTPRSQRIPSQHRQLTAAEILEDGNMPSAPALRRTGSNLSVKSNGEREQRKSADSTSSPRRSSQLSVQNPTIGEERKTGSFLSIRSSANNSSFCRKSGSADDELIRYPIKLSRLLERVRAKRSKIENKLVDLLTSREKMRECIQYLQSLRAIVDNPPTTPTRSLAKTKAPSIDKAMLLLTVYGEHINQISEGLPPSSALKMLAAPSLVSSSELKGNLNDAEEFVKIMLQVNTCALSTTAYTSNSGRYSMNEYAGFNFNGDCAVGGSISIRESFASASGRGSISSQRLAPPPPINASSPLVRRLFNDDCGTGTRSSSAVRSSVTGTTSVGGFSIPTAGTGTAGAGSGVPEFVCDPTPQMLRSPPPGYKQDFDLVMTHLEEIWNCELEAFQTVENLAQCLSQRGQTWQRLKLLREQERSMVLPTKEDLYDVEF